jgi:hypothetical protein
MTTGENDLAKKHIDFSDIDCFPPEIQTKLGDPEACHDPDVLHYLLSGSEIRRILFLCAPNHPNYGLRVHVATKERTDRTLP